MTTDKTSKTNQDVANTGSSETTDTQVIRHFIRELRTAQFMSQDALAQRAGIGRETLSEYETGKRDPRPATMRRIAEALNVTPPWRIYDLPEKVASILMAMPAAPAATDDDDESAGQAAPAKPTPKVRAKHAQEQADEPVAVAAGREVVTVDSWQGNPDDLWFLTESGAFIPAFQNLPMELSATTAVEVTERWQHVAMEWNQQPNPEHLRAFLERWIALSIRTRQVKGKRIDRAAFEQEMEEMCARIVTPIYQHVLKEVRRARGESS